VSIESVYVSPDGAGDGPTREVCDRAHERGARLFPLAPGVLEKVADTVTPQPVLAVLPMLNDPPPFEPDPWSLLVVMVDVRDPGNAGTVLRAADASGCQGVVFGGDSVDPYNPKTVRSSAGSLFHVPFVVRNDGVSMALELAGAGFRTLGTGVRAGDDYAGLDWSVPTALFLGNESSGLDPALTDTCSGSVAIPMAGRAESLNVGVACAVLCFEALRQRRAGSSAAPTISKNPSATPPEHRRGGAQGTSTW